MGALRPDDPVGKPHPKPTALKAADPAMQVYLEEIGRTALLTAEQECVLAREVARGSREAFDALVQANLRFVVFVARRHRSRGLPLMDLIAEGNLGLMNAVRKFDPDAGCRFTTYAWWWVTQAIQRALRWQSHLVRIPTRMADRMQHWRRADEQLRLELGRAPTEPEMALALDLPALVVRRIAQSLETVDRMLPVGSGDENGQDPLAAARDEMAPGPGEAAQQREQLDELRRLLARLTPRDRQILSLRYGLTGGGPHNLRDIGELLDLSHERVRRLEKQALGLLRSSLRATD